MVSDCESYFIKTVEIPCESDNVNFQAREIGFFSSLFEQEEKTDLKLFYLYFLEHAERELENANERLAEFRAELTSYDKQQRELRAV